MGTIKDQIDTAFRDFATDGVATSGAHEVIKSEVRAIGPLIESAVANAGLGSLLEVIYSTKAGLDADLAHAANTVALVYGDATDANNDLYVKVGASGSGSWTNTGALHSIIEGIAQPYVDAADAIGDEVQAALDAVGTSITEVAVALSAFPVVEKYKEPTGSGSPSIFRAISWTSGTTYRVRLLAKAAGRSFLNIFCNGGALFNATFDLESGIVSSAAAGNTATITRIGSGWYLCTVTRAATATATANLQFRLGTDGSTFTYSGDGSSGIYAMSASLKVSGSLTELLTATKFSDAYWTKSAGVSVASEEATGEAVGARVDALDQALNGASPVRIEETAGTVSPALYISRSYVAGRAYKAFAIAKAGERKRLNIFSNGGALFDATFNLETGTATGTGASMTNRGGGEWLCEVTLVASSTASANLQLRVFADTGGNPHTGDDTAGLYVLSAGLYEDGVIALNSNADALLSLWLRQNITVELDTSQSFGSLEARLSALEGGAVSGSALQGKKVAAIGTSITEQNQYVSALETISGMDVTNLGTSGGSIASGSHYGSLYIYDAIASIPTDSEIVTIEAGINDFGTSNSDLGALGDTTTSTFYGALYAAVVAIRARAPSARIIFLTPYSGGPGTATHRIGVTNSKGLKLEQFQRAVEEVAGYCGYPCIDVGRASGIGYFTSSIYMGDDLHINAIGGSKYARYVFGDMLRLFANGFFND